jgi:hypothetical protein
MTRCFVLFLLVLSSPAFAQESQPSPRQKGTLYATWGYHRDRYTNSTITFKDNNSYPGLTNYDFTFHHAKAKDQPDFHDLLHTPLSVPQYVFNIGYFFNDKHDLGIEVSWDHLKYVVVDNQVMHVTGYYNGMQHNVDTLVTPDFVHYEHTNGNNYLMVSLVKRIKLIQSSFAQQSVSSIFKIGAGLTDPKTDSKIFNHHNDGPFRVSGIVVGASASLRYNFLKFFFLEASAKGALVDYTSVKLYENGRAKQRFASIQLIGAGGLNIPL